MDSILTNPVTTSAAPVADAPLVWPLWVVIILLLAVVAFLLWKQLRSSIVQETTKPDTSKNITTPEITQLQNTCNYYKEESERYKALLDTFKSAATQYVKMREGLASLTDSDKPFADVIHLLQKNNIYPSGINADEGATLLQRLADRAADTDLIFSYMERIKNMQRLIHDFFDELQRQEPPGDVPTQRHNRTVFMALAMMSLDVVDSIDNPNATDDRQGINVRLLTGKLLPEEAAAEAREVNDALHDSSYKWARALQAALRYGVDLDTEKLLILRGWRFKGYHSHGLSQAYTEKDNKQ